MNQNISYWLWGNILLGGLIGFAIDLTTSGLYSLTPDEISVDLEKD